MSHSDFLAHLTCRAVSMGGQGQPGEVSDVLDAEMKCESTMP